MKKILLPVAVAIAASPVAVLAEPVIGSHSYLSLQAISYDDLDTDSSWGGRAQIAYFLNDSFYISLRSSLQRLTYSETWMGSTEKLTMTALTSMVGGGIEVPVADNVGFYGEGGFGLASISAKLTYEGDSWSDSDSGTIVGWGAGVRFKQDEAFGQFGISNSKVDFGNGNESDWENTFGIRLGYFVSDNIALGADLEFASDVTAFGVGITSTF